MKIHFSKLRYKNILSTGNVFTEIDLEKDPLTLIIGHNGAGKSTILDALCFALFGKPFRNINKPGLINSINDADMLVEVEFRAENKHYLVRRGQKPNVFEIFRNGELIAQDAKTGDYQKQLETNILGFNMKAFNQIVILGSASFTPFMQLQKDDRRKIIEELLDIKVFSTMNSVLKLKVKGVQESARTVKERITSVMNSIEMQKKFVEESKKSNQEIIDSKKNSLKVNMERIEKLAKDAELVQRHIDVILHGITDEQKVRSKTKTMESFRIKIDTNLDKANADLQFYQNNDNCPKCKQVLANKQEQIEECQHKVVEYSLGMNKLIEQQNKVEERITEIVATRKKIDAHQNELTRLQASIAQMQKFSTELCAEIEELVKKKPVSDDLIQVSKKLVSDLEQLNLDRKDLVEKKAYLDVATTLLKDNGIKAKIIKQYLPIINKLVNKYLTQMDFFVNFNINEEFKETIKSRYRDVFSYDNFSEGEKLRIDLSLLFTWRAIAKMKNSMNTNLLILDEVLDGSLDVGGVEMFTQLLQSFNNDGTNIFIISHKGDVLQDKFSSILKFDKIKNFSEIVK